MDILRTITICERKKILNLRDCRILKMIDSVNAGAPARSLIMSNIY